MAATMPLMNATPLAKATSVAKEPTPARPPDELLVTVQAAKQGNTTAQMLLMDPLAPADGASDTASQAELPAFGG